MNLETGPCRTVVQTAELTQCFTDAGNRVEKDMQVVYAGILKALGPEDRDRLVASQGAWRTGRDFDCQSEYRLYGGGSGGPPAKAACRYFKTKDRTRDLTDTYGWVVSRQVTP